jgi:hypothetical protein
MRAGQFSTLVPEAPSNSVAAGLARSSRSRVYVVHLVERLFLGKAGWCSMETAAEARQTE